VPTPDQIAYEPLTSTFVTAIVISVNDIP
jgi:hypothetical protein